MFLFCACLLLSAAALLCSHIFFSSNTKSFFSTEFERKLFFLYPYFYYYVSSSLSQQKPPRLRIKRELHHDDVRFNVLLCAMGRNLYIFLLFQASEFFPHHNIFDCFCTMYIQVSTIHIIFQKTPGRRVYTGEKNPSSFGHDFC